MQYVVDEVTVAELRRLKRKVDGIKGPGITNAPDGITIAPVTARRTQQVSTSGTNATILQVVGPCLTGAMYEAKTATKLAAELDPTAGGALTLAEILEFAADVDCYILCLPEIGETSHGLADDDIVSGELWGTATDGLPVYCVRAIGLSAPGGIANVPQVEIDGTYGARWVQDKPKFWQYPQ